MAAEREEEPAENAQPVDQGKWAVVLAKGDGDCAAHVLHSSLTVARAAQATARRRSGNAHRPAAPFLTVGLLPVTRALSMRVCAQRGARPRSAMDTTSPPSVHASLRRWGASVTSFSRAQAVAAARARARSSGWWCVPRASCPEARKAGGGRAGAKASPPSGRRCSSPARSLCARLSFSGSAVSLPPALLACCAEEV